MTEPDNNEIPMSLVQLHQFFEAIWTVINSATGEGDVTVTVRKRQVRFMSISPSLDVGEDAQRLGRWEDIEQLFRKRNR